MNETAERESHKRTRPTKRGRAPRIRTSHRTRGCQKSNDNPGTERPPRDAIVSKGPTGTELRNYSPPPTTTVYAGDSDTVRHTASRPAHPVCMSRPPETRPTTGCLITSLTVLKIWQVKAVS